MEYINDLLELYRENKKKQLIEKSISAFHQGIISESSLKNIIEKARTGQYSDNAENRRLKRVGQEYGTKGKEDEKDPKDKKQDEQPKEGQNTGDLTEQAKNSSVAQLEAAIKESPNPEVRQAAHNELARREKEEKPQSEENKKFGEGYEKDNSATTDKENGNGKIDNKEDKQVQAKDSTVKESDQPSVDTEIETDKKESKSTSDNKEGEKKGLDIVDKIKLKQQQSKDLDAIYQSGVDFIEEKLKDTGFEVESVSKSLTDFGKSWYIKIKGGFEGQQIRISDHSVGDKRFMNDPTLAFIDYGRLSDSKWMEDTMKLVVSLLDSQVKTIEKRKKDFENQANQELEIEQESKSFIDGLKKEGKALHNSNRTYQTLEEVKQKHPDWEHIYQNKLQGGAFSYDYIKKNEGYGNYNLKLKKDYFNFLKENGVIEDSKIEKSEQDTLTHTFSGKINKEEVLIGGKADNLTIEDIAKKHNVDVDKIKKQLQMGIVVEMEHTNDPKQAIEISLDHLTESPEYYTKLAKMESTFDKDSKEKNDAK